MSSSNSTARRLRDSSQSADPNERDPKRSQPTLVIHGSITDYCRLKTVPDWLCDCEQYHYEEGDSKLLDNTLCPISHCPIVEPVTLSCCTNSICKRCADKCRDNCRSKCPVCNRSYQMIDVLTWQDAGLMLKNILDGLKVKCDACDQVMDRARLPTHYDKICPKVVLECTAEGCEWSGLRQEFEAHTDQCPHILVHCALKCSKVMARQTHHQHVTDECPNTLLTCDQCHETIQRSLYDQHKQETCDFRIVTCRAKDIGCDYKNTAQDVLHKHQPQCSVLKLLPSIKEKDKQMEELQRKIQTLQQENDVRMTQLERSIRTSMEKSSREIIKEKDQQIEELQRKIQTLQQQNDARMTQLEQLIQSMVEQDKQAKEKTDLAKQEKMVKCSNCAWKGAFKDASRGECRYHPGYHEHWEHHWRCCGRLIDAPGCKVSSSGHSLADF